MKRLIESEFKKIFKSKINIILLIALFLFSGYRIYFAYDTTITDYKFQNVDGKDVDVFDYYREADRLYHEYAGVLDESLIKQMETDFNKITSSYQRSIPDTEFMTYLYGADYEKFLTNARDGKYDYDELQNRMADMKVSGFASEEGDSKYVRAYFDYYYMEDRVISLYHQLYNQYYVFENTRPMEEERMQSPSFNKLYRRVEDRKGLTEMTYFEEVYKDDYQGTSGKELLDFYNQKYLTSSTTMDSNIGNTLFVNALNSIEFTSLVVLVLCLANTFAMERRHKVDQILVPSASGWSKITMAKISCGLLLSIAMIALQVLMVLIVSYCIVPMRNLDLVYAGQAQIFMNYNVLEYIFTYKDIIFSGILLMLLASMATVLLTVVFSYISKSRFLTAIPLLLIVFVSGSMDFFSLVFPGSVIDAFLPSHMFHFTQYYQLNTHSLINVVNVFGQMVELKNIVMIFWVLMIIVLIGGMYIHTKKYHTVKN